MTRSPPIFFTNKRVAGTVLRTVPLVAEASSLAVRKSSLVLKKPTEQAATKADEEEEEEEEDAAAAKQLQQQPKQAGQVMT